VRELAEDLSRRRADDGDLAPFHSPAVVEPQTLEALPFADPILWAPFMLVGRA
jgi:hypothetical protein